ncbi:MAG: radical SAM protein [bacterium]|nr:radical SAM protein [bacterium]
MKRILCNYYVTYRCNAGCEFCDFRHHDKFKNSPHASLADVLDNLAQLKKIGIRIIDFTGGEPLLNPDLPEMLAAAKSIGMMTSVTTNCMLYPKKAGELKGKIDLLHFSLDSIIPEEHNRIREADCYNHVMYSIEKALSLGENPDILFTVTEHNYQEIEELYAFTKKLKLILILNPVFSHHRNEIIPEDALTTIEELSRLPYIYLSRGFIRIRRQGGNNIDDPVCKAVSSVIVISPDNNLMLPCYHRAETAIPINGDLRTALASDKYMHYLENEGRFGFCKGCTINCYFEPSFALSLNKFMFDGIPGKIKYITTKFLYQKIIKGLNKSTVI